jgi:ABC-type nitrate/sulfonate/bicarbonate transport system substrate-binding protein
MQILILKHVRLIAALCFGGSILSVNGAAAQTPVKFSIDWVFQGAHAPFAVAIQKNYYKREGLDVTMHRGAGSGDTIGSLPSAPMTSDTATPISWSNSTMSTRIR